ncbi:hypothetical protein [Azospirillum endophyticum]
MDGYGSGRRVIHQFRVDFRQINADLHFDIFDTLGFMTYVSQ